MNISPVEYIERLNELLEKKKALLADILGITRAQTEAVTEDGMAGLSDLIKNKQLKIDEINKLDEEFGIYYQRLKSALGISRLDQIDAEKLDGAAQARRLKELTAEILDVIRDIAVIERENSRKSKKLLEKFGNEIKKINQGKRANNAYKPGAFGVPSYFVDKKK